MKICEDIPQYLDSDVPGLAERPINIFLPRLFRVTSVFLFIIVFFHFLLLYPPAIYSYFLFLFQFFQSPHASLRKLSLGSVNQYIMLMPSVSVYCLSSLVIKEPLKFGISSNSLNCFVKALYVSMDQYLQGLFILSNDPSAEVRKLVSS